MRNQTYRERTMELSVVRFALEHGYKHCASNEFAIRHFRFRYDGMGAPEIEVNWFKGQECPSVTIGDTGIHGDTTGQHALEQLKKFW